MDTHHLSLFNAEMVALYFFALVGGFNFRLKLLCRDQVISRYSSLRKTDASLRKGRRIWLAGYIARIYAILYLTWLVVLPRLHHFGLKTNDSESLLYWCIPYVLLLWVLSAFVSRIEEWITQDSYERATKYSDISYDLWAVEFVLLLTIHTLGYFV